MVSWAGPPGLMVGFKNIYGTLGEVEGTSTSAPDNSTLRTITLFHGGKASPFYARYFFLIRVSRTGYCSIC